MHPAVQFVLALKALECWLAMADYMVVVLNDLFLYGHEIGIQF